MPNLNPVRRCRPLLYAAAALLAALTILYTATWMYYVCLSPQVEIGIDETYSSAGVEIGDVHKDGPAEKAGLKAHDLIVAINGTHPDTELSSNAMLLRTWLKAKPGDTVVLTVQRPEQPQPFIVTPVFRANQGAGDTHTLAYTVGKQVLDSYPLLFLIVGLTVLFLRVDDRNAWLVAMVFVAFITAGPMPSEFGAAPGGLQPLLLAFRTICNALLPGLFYLFFAVFPTRSPIDRKAPWLKWAFLVVGACLGFGGVRYGIGHPLPFIGAVLPYSIARGVRIVIGYGARLLGALSLLLNVLSGPTAADRRKLKVILWGTAVGVTPIYAIRAAEDFLHFDSPFWLSVVCVFLLLLFPLSFAYAVVKHQVMDIPVLLKRSARYFVAERGFVFLILAISVGLTLWFGQAFSRYFSAGEGRYSHWCDLWRADDLGRDRGPPPRAHSAGPRLFPQLLRRAADSGRPGCQDAHRHDARRSGFLAGAEHSSCLASPLNVCVPEE